MINGLEENKKEQDISLFDVRIKALCKSVAYRLKHSPQADEVTKQLHVQLMESIKAYIETGTAPQDNTPNIEEQKSKFMGNA